MDKRNIIKAFLRQGMLLSPDELDGINENNYRDVLEKRAGKTGHGDGGKAAKGVRKRETWLTTAEFVKRHNENFEKIKKMLLKKTDAVSVNKGKKVFSESTLIVRVREKTPRGFFAEDVTGGAEIVTEKDEINEGDVIAVTGRFRDNLFYPRQVTWPDVPLVNKPGDPGRIIVLGGGGGNDGVTPDRKCRLKRDMFDKDYLVVSYSGENEIDRERAVGFLKRRMIPGAGVVGEVIDNVPDVFWLHNNGENWTRNYRGVIIVSTEKGSKAVINRRDVRFESAADGGDRKRGHRNLIKELKDLI